VFLDAADSGDSFRRDTQSLPLFARLIFGDPEMNGVGTDRRREKRRDIRQMIIQELSFSGKAMTKQQRAAAAALPRIASIIASALPSASHRATSATIGNADICTVTRNVAATNPADS
jgi:hypothetical protein